jgi:sn-glycerol 3-phosphate transport system ATP-binding protein
MGRAIVREPQAFLFDEPLSNLDAKLRLAMRIEIRRLHNRLEATSIFVTHDQVEAMTLADLVVVMNAGQIEQAGRPSEVYARPATRFVATFIGAPAMNLLPGRVTARGVAEFEGGGALAFDPTVFAAEPGRSVEIGMRPEDIAIAAPDQPHALAFSRELIEDLGPNRLLHGRIGAHALTISTAAGVIIPEAAAMRLAAPTASVHLFDPASGRSLRAAA